ncbi:MAG: 3'-5' exonuclease domain-containing protein 2 [Tannerellaceae bacterium]|jgi:ribonuclease D|nr:3'-5' exonuclease domain-containing protein 2 [Tannerellaceae bacterium]
MPYLTHIDNTEIASMEAEAFPGRIVVISAPEAVQPAIDHLRQAPAIGFDTETRPNFRKGQHNEVALLQLSTADCCYLFRLNRLGIPPELGALLADEHVLKIGLSLPDDFRALRQRTKVTFANFIDLQNFVRRTTDIQETGLRKIYAIIFRKKISKGQQLSDWESPLLTPAQQRYAALDAWACLRIYERLSAEKQL